MKKELIMPNFSSISITIRRCYLMSSTIIGFARIVIDREILLKEIPIFRSDNNMLVQISAGQVAICAENMNIEMLNRMVWNFRGIIEMAILEEWKRMEKTKYKSNG